MNSITITVPMDYFALNRASDMLHGMALDVDKQQAGGSPRDAWARPEEAAEYADFAEAVPTDAVPATPDEDKDAASVFGKPEPATTATTATAPAPAPPAGAAEEATSDSTISEEAEYAEHEDDKKRKAAGLSSSVELDSDGLPWDHRIHSGSKGKLAKTGQWKKKRGVDPELVEQVEAELHAAMSAGPANPVESEATPQPESPAPATGPTEPPKPAAPAPAPAPAEPAKPGATGAITTFPALMQRITASGLAQADVTAAVNKQGLQSLPLLAARPDLIPAVAAQLFPEG